MYNVHSTLSSSSWLIWKNILIMSSVTDEKNSVHELIPQDQATNRQIRFVLLNKTNWSTFVPKYSIHNELLVIYHFSMI